MFRSQLVRQVVEIKTGTGASEHQKRLDDGGPGGGAGDHAGFACGAGDGFERIRRRGFPQRGQGRRRQQGGRAGQPARIPSRQLSRL